MSLLEEFAFGDVSLEALQGGTQQKEREFEIYGQMKNLSDLSKAPKKELQEQWGLPVEKIPGNAASGNIRVRMIDDKSYVFTSKVKEKDGNDEVEHDVGEALFTHFAKFADQGLRKVRHFFPTEDGEFTYEVDAFYNAVGQFVPWVKIDLEIPEGQTIDDLPDLPFEMDDIRVIPPGRKSPEDLAFVRELFDKYFTSKNKFIDHPVEVPSLETYNEVIKHKEHLFDLADRIRGTTGILSYNESKREAALKQVLFEAAMAIEALFKDINDIPDA